MSPTQVRTAARITMEGDRWVGPLIDSVGGGRRVGTASEALYHEAIIPLWSDGGAALHALSRSERLAEQPLTLFLVAVCDDLRTVVGGEFPEIRSLAELRGMLMFWIWDAVTRPSKSLDSRPDYRATLLATWARIAGDEVTCEIEAELTATLDRWTRASPWTQVAVGTTGCEKKLSQNPVED